MRRHATSTALALAIAAVGAFLGGCGGSPGSVGRASGTLSTEAVFSDVGSLIPGSPVDMADVPVGMVTAIHLTGNRALVDMRIDRSAQVPLNVVAQVKLTSLLGQDFVELVPPSSDSRALETGHAVALLGDGMRISHAEVVPGVQQLVQYGVQVFGAIDASELAQLVATGAQGFQDQSAHIREVLNGFSSTAQGYAAQSQTISALVGEMNQLTSSIAPSSSADAQAVSNFAHTTTILVKESMDFENLLQSLDGLAQSSRGVLDNYIPDISTFFGTLQGVSQALVKRLHALGGFVKWLPAHNLALEQIVSGGYVQVLDDLVVCGVPGARQQDNSAGSCNGAS